MDFIYENHQDMWESVFRKEVIDLSEVRFLDPWGMGLVCLKAIENSLVYGNSEIDLPENTSTTTYLHRMHLGGFLTPLGYDCSALRAFGMHERDNLNVHEIMHCRYRSDFDGRLSSKIRHMLRDFGLKPEDEQKVTGLIGELGNNVYDHNEGSWPTDMAGAILIGQKYSGGIFSPKVIQFVVADPGVGFKGSLQRVSPPPKTDLEAINLGLVGGVTGRVGEKRGNGLQLIRQWTIGDFSGELRIYSGNGLVALNKDGKSERTVRPVIGTLAEVIVRYR